MYFDPHDAMDLRAAIARVTYDDDVRQALSVASARLLPEYSLSEMARKTKETYLKALSTG